MSKKENEFGVEESIDLEDTAMEDSVPTDTATAVVGTTDKEEEAREKKLERAQEWARMKANLRSRKVELLALLGANSFDEQYVKDMDTLIGSERTPAEKKEKQPKLALRNEFIAMFYDTDSEDAVPQIGRIVKGLDLFMAKGIGKDKANALCAEAIKRAISPDKRHWITAVPDAQYEAVNNYQLVAVGAEAPTDWKGFMPDEVK